VAQGRAAGRQTATVLTSRSHRRRDALDSAHGHDRRAVGTTRTTEGRDANGFVVEHRIIEGALKRAPSRTVDRWRIEPEDAVNRRLHAAN
jgi:hypothetical protein